MQSNHLKRPKHGETVLEVRGIVKRFPGVVANDRIDFEMKAGEIHAILGENGAGKSTLMNILFGLLQPDEGEIYIGGQRVHFKSPLDAINLGIGMVHQHRKLVPAHTVLENIILGHPRAGKLLNLKRAGEVRGYEVLGDDPAVRLPFIKALRSLV
ncbi:MAG: ATP-binding cassette domain-containing protein, partial [Anaerolineae bacterium]